MMNQQTMDKLEEMRLNGLAAAWLEQQSRPDYGGLGFDERLGLLSIDSSTPGTSYGFWQSSSGIGRAGGSWRSEGTAMRKPARCQRTKTAASHAWVWRGL